MLNFYKRIIFYCFLILLFFKSFAFAGWDDFAKGSDIDLLGKDITNVNQIYGNSTYTGFGGEVTSHSLTNDGSIVVYRCEVNNNLYVDGYSYMGQMTISGSSKVSDDYGFGCGNSSDFNLIWRTLGNDSINIAVGCGSAAQSGNINIVSLLYKESNFNGAVETNPLLRIFSAEDPDTDNTQFLSFKHDQTDGVIDCGKGNVKVGSTGFQLYSRTEAELKAITPTAAGAIYYDSTNYAIIVSTGTGAGAFGLITDGTSLPTGW